MISVITPCYNNPSQLEKFLGSVMASEEPAGGREVIVVDDGSEADMGKVVGKFDGVRYIRLEGNTGPSAARNRGAREARGEFLVFFDSDVMLKHDTLKRFEDDFKAGHLAAAGEYDIEPIEDGFFPRFKALLEESWMPPHEYVSIFLLRAAGVKKDVFEKAGGFDEEIKTASVEDYEFADRLKKIGVNVYYDPEILVRHHHPDFRKQMKVFYLRARDWADIFVKRRGRFDNFCATPAEGVSSVAGSTMLISLFLALVINNAIPAFVAAACLAVYLAVNVKFMRVVYKRRGLFFIPVALAVKLPLGLAISTGFTAGLLKIMKGKPKT